MVGRNHQDGDATVGQIVNDAVNVSTNRYIHATGRLIKNKNAWLGGEAFCQQDFLLVATRKRAYRL